MANEIVECVIIVVLGLRHRRVEAPKAQIMAAIEEDNDNYYIPWLGLAPSQFLRTFQLSLASLVPRLLPSFLSHTVQKTGREPGRFDHVRDDVLCVVLCVVLVIELSPTHTVLYYSALSESPC